MDYVCADKLVIGLFVYRTHNTIGYIPHNKDGFETITQPLIDAKKIDIIHNSVDILNLSQKNQLYSNIEYLLQSPYFDKEIKDCINTRINITELIPVVDMI